MSPVDIGLWVLVIVLAMAAAWWTIPRPVELDWERFFKLSLVTVLRGTVEERDGTEEEWLELGRAHVWYHPGARELGRKLADPEAYRTPIPARVGEQKLLEVLRKTPADERLATVFGEALGGDVELYDDPMQAGPDWDLEKALGPGAGWEGVAAWTPELLEVLRRRNEGTHYAVVGGDSALAAVIEGALGTCAHLEATELGALVDALEALLPEMSDRLVLIGVGEGAAAITRALHDSAGLRDRTRLVLGIGAALDVEWLAEHFTHEAMDTEIARATPYLSVGFVEDSVDEAALAATRWPELETPKSGRKAIDAVELGVLPGPVGDYPVELLGKAVVVTVTGRLVLGG